MQATSNPSIPIPPSGGFFNPRNINRILLVLGFVGIFDASLLSAEVLFKLNLSCGVESGCSVIASHPSAKWFNIPVAYFGLAAYLAFTVLASIRAIMGSGTPKILTYAGYGMAVFGALTSIYLQYTALVVIKAFCPYCFASAVNMILTLVFYAMLTSRISSTPEPVAVPVETEEYPRAKPLPESRDAQWVAIGTLATIVAVVLGANYLQSKHKAPTIAPGDMPLGLLAPLSDDVHGYGDPKAPIKITEFADFACIHCQKLTPMLHQFVDAHPGKVFAIWRNYPLKEIHPMAVMASLIAEYAGRHGKFWQYADKIYAIGDEPKTWDQIAAPAQAIGLNMDDLKKEIQNVNGPEMVAVQKDMNDASHLGVNTTPTFFIQMTGEKARIAVASDVFDVLSSPPYTKILGQ